MTIEELEDQLDGTLCTIAGIVSKVQHTRTKKGEIMGYVTVDDMTSSMDVIVFPSLLAENIELIVEDRIISVRGRLDMKEDQTKFVATSISGIDLNSKDKQNVNIRIKQSDLDEDTSSHLNSILKSHPGKIYVNLIVPSGDSYVTLRLSDEFRVEINDLLCSEIKSLLGPGTSIYIS
jgi:DNA polymerase-3 subunit alpha